MTLLALVTESKSIHRMVTALGESTEVPERSPSRAAVLGVTESPSAENGAS